MVGAQRGSFGRGHGLVEFAPILPASLLFIPGIAEVDSVRYVYAKVSNAAWEAPRVGRRPPLEPATPTRGRSLPRSATRSRTEPTGPWRRGPRAR